MIAEKQGKKIDYRSRNHKLSTEEREQIKARLYNFSNQTNTSRLFKTSLQNINEAFKGNNARLLNKIKIYVEKMEARNGVEQ